MRCAPRPRGFAPPHRRRAHGVAYGYMKKNFFAAETEPFATVLDLEAIHQTRCGLTDDHREGPRRVRREAQAGVQGSLAIAAREGRSKPRHPP